MYIFHLSSLQSEVECLLTFVHPDILAVLLSDVLLLLQEKDQRYVFATVVSDLSFIFVSSALSNKTLCLLKNT